MADLEVTERWRLFQFGDNPPVEIGVRGFLVAEDVEATEGVPVRLRTVTYVGPRPVRCSRVGGKVEMLGARGTKPIKKLSKARKEALIEQNGMIEKRVA